MARRMGIREGPGEEVGHPARHSGQRLVGLMGLPVDRPAGSPCPRGGLEAFWAAFKRVVEGAAVWRLEAAAGWARRSWRLRTAGCRCGDCLVGGSSRAYPEQGGVGRGWEPMAAVGGSGGEDWRRVAGGVRRAGAVVRGGGLRLRRDGRVGEVWVPLVAGGGGWHGVFRLRREGPSREGKEGCEVLSSGVARRGARRVRLGERDGLAAGVWGDGWLSVGCLRASRKASAVVGPQFGLGVRNADYERVVVGVLVRNGTG